MAPRSPLRRPAEPERPGVRRPNPTKSPDPRDAEYRDLMDEWLDRNGRRILFLVLVIGVFLGLAGLGLWDHWHVPDCVLSSGCS